MDNFWKEVWESCKIRKTELFFFLIFAAAAIWMGLQAYEKEKTEPDSGTVQETELHAVPPQQEADSAPAAVPQRETDSVPSGTLQQKTDSAVSGTVEQETDSVPSGTLQQETDSVPGSMPQQEMNSASASDKDADIQTVGADSSLSDGQPEESVPDTEPETVHQLREIGESETAASETDSRSDVTGLTETESEESPETGASPFIHSWRKKIAYLADEEVRGPVYPDLRCWRILPGMEIPEEFRLRTAEANLKGIIQNMVDEASGDWSVWFRNLRTQETISVNPGPMKSASIMKLFVMGAVYREIEQGNLKRTDELISMLKDMVTYSDNEDSNRLLYMIGDSDYAAGVEKVNAFIRSCGFSDMTIEYNGFNSEELVLDRSHLNQVTAQDSGRLLEAIYRREWGSRQVSNEVEQMLINQTNHSKIPAGLPDGTVCGNKTGEMDRTENDAAIVYGPLCDYVLVVLSSDWDSMDEAIQRIRRISHVVYRYTQGEMVPAV